MDIKELFRRASGSKFIVINEDELSFVLKNCIIIRTEDTHLSDLIRLLKFEKNLFLQEITSKNEIIIRKVNSMKDADLFIQDRLDYYERKWDGCGCKINYYE